MASCSRLVCTAGVACWLVCVLVLTTVVAQSPAPGGALQPEEIRQKDPGFLVRADVNKSTRSYRNGDTLTITVASEADAYVYVLYKQADGQVFLIYPNATQPSNKVKARQAVNIPASDDLFRWTVGPPFGKEYIKVIATRKPLEELADPAFRQKFFNVLGTKTVKGIALELGAREIAWAEDCVEINTYEGDVQFERQAPRRVGLFIGVGKYTWFQKVRKGADGKTIAIHDPGHRDARMLSALLREVGQFTDIRVLSDDRTDPEAVQEAFLRWLPSVSRPGDTVLIYYSGRAFPIPGSPTPTGAVLALKDFMLPEHLKSGLDAERDGKLDPELKSQLAIAAKIYQEAGSEDHGAVALMQQWGVSDRMFTHFLQGLAGRQVVVVLDAAWTDAFMPSAAPGVAIPKGILDHGVSRLESLGQGDIAVLGAGATGESDVMRDPEGLSLMTQCLIQAIHAAPATLTLQEAHAEVRKSVEARFEQVNAQRRASGQTPLAPDQPTLLNTCTRAVLLKP